MRYYSWMLKMITLIFLLIGVVGFAAEKDLPVMKGKKVVATVNGEPITLDELNRDLITLNKAIDREKRAGKENDSELLRRLINIRLIVQEGTRIGLNELPEIKERVGVFSRLTLREELMEKHVKEIKVDHKEVEKLYRESVKEYKIRSFFVEKKEDVKKMEEEVKGGKNFGEITKKFVAEGKAKEDPEKNYLRNKDLLPEVAEVLSKMEIGWVSPIIPLKSGFVILKIEDIRFPESPEAKERARGEVLRQKRIQSLGKYNGTLIKKYVKIHKEVLNMVDYDSKEPGFNALLKDKRVIAEIKGESPITVGELAEYLRQQLYHGVERAVESKKLNQKKIPVFDEMLHKRVFRKEALRLGLDKTESYRNKVEEHEDSLIFETFVKKAVFPDIKIKEEEIKNYYNEHLEEYSFPEMMRINSLIFKKREDAEGAIEKLRKGTEFQWISKNAEGLVEKDAQGILPFGGNLITTKSLPEGALKAVSGARAGDLRLYGSPEGHFYVLVIQDVIPSKPKPYEESRQSAAQKVFDEKLKKAVEEYADKLGAASDVKIYLKEN